MNVELVILNGIIESPYNMGKISNYVEIDTLEETCEVNPLSINSTLLNLYKKGLVNINQDLVRITDKGIAAIGVAA